MLKEGARLLSAQGLLPRERGGRAWLRSGHAGALTLAIVLPALLIALRWDLYDKATTTAYLAKNELFVTRIADALPPGAAWATDRYTTAYFAGRPPLFLYSPAGAPLVRAKDPAEIDRLLSGMGVRMIALHDPTPDWWPATALHQALVARSDVKRLTSGTWQIFLVPPPSR